MPSTPKEEIEARIHRLQELLREEGMDGALVVQRADLFYLTGTGQDAQLLVPAAGDPTLMVRKTFQRAVEESPLESIHPVTKLTQVRDHVRSVLGNGSLRLGMELDVLPVNLFRMYEGILTSCEILDVSPAIRRLRMVKSPYEIDLIRKAAQVADAMFREVENLLEEGITEFEFAARVEAEARKRGHQGFIRVRAFNGEVFYGHIMSGVNLTVPSCSVGPTGGPGPHAVFPQGPGFKRIGKHEPVQIDLCGEYGGYMSDQARTFYVEEPPEKLARIHETALEIQKAIVDSVTVGTPAENLYEIALSMAREAGLAEGFMGHPLPVSFVGHGVGLELDELPLIGKRSGTPLEEGMVFALEPKFIIPGEGLAGIENTYLVTSEGAERLTPFDDALQVVAPSKSQ